MSESRWNVQPIIATQGGRIEALSLNLIPGDAVFGAPPEEDE